MAKAPLRVSGNALKARGCWNSSCLLGCRPIARTGTPRISPYQSLRASFRYASTATAAGSAESRSLVARLKNLGYGTSIAAFLVLSYYYVTDTRAGVHRWLVVPLLRWFYDDAEDAHEAGTRALKRLYEFGIHPRERGDPDKSGDLQVEVFGHVLSNPIGTSAGIDKHAEIPSALLAIGPAIVEVGGATPYPQDGNPKPRVFRLPSQKALINRYGLNSEGADNVAMRLRQRVREFAYSIGFGIDEVAEQRILDGEAGVPPGSLVEGKLMAVQIAKNKFTPDTDVEAVKRDYVYCAEALAKYADIVVVNVSSPNTPGLRGLQNEEPLTHILKGVVEAAQRAKRKTSPAVMVKVSPDEDSDAQISGICEAIWASGVDGVIVGNTTKRRPDPLPQGYTLSDKESALLLEEGGYSGPQLFERTLDLVKRYRRFLDHGSSGRSSVRTSPKGVVTEKARPEGGTRMEEANRESSRSSLRPIDPKGVITEKAKPEEVTHTTEPLDPGVAGRIEATVKRDLANLKEPFADKDASPKPQPLIRLPERHELLSSKPDQAMEAPALSSSTHIDQLPPVREDLPSSSSSVADSPSSSSSDVDSLSSSSSVADSPLTVDHPKVIFATGGITDGQKALEVLDAGASVALVYTALVYGGVGTISRFKESMRDEIKRKKI